MHQTRMLGIREGNCNLHCKTDCNSGWHKSGFASGSLNTPERAAAECSGWFKLLATTLGTQPRAVPALALAVPAQSQPCPPAGRRDDRDTELAQEPDMCSAFADRAASTDLLMPRFGCSVFLDSRSALLRLYAGILVLKSFGELHRIIAHTSQHHQQKALHLSDRYWLEMLLLRSIFLRGLRFTSSHHEVQSPLR